MKNIRFATLALAIITMAGLTVAAQAADPVTRTITVTGVGEIASKPDMAEVQISVISDANNAGDAMAQSSEKAKNLVKTAIGNGVAEADIQTGTVSLAPLYKVNKNEKGEDITPPVIVGHRAALSTRIMVRNPGTVGTLLDNLVKAGANRLSGIRFKVSEREKLLNDARRLAIANAKSVATLMAWEAGAVVGKVLRIEDAGSTVPQGRMMDMESESIGMPVMPGEIEVAVRVNVMFTLNDVQ
ncbi:MAG: hypothetical protein A3G18_08515 [Rhodospirillales bacterium RIFCSPLOWO2_12_FULL_58_28]|nr:MAG: hypothetical protein A3H92_01370 [Rhodospirillales bacterium RIFCSPLOWO2_02_FULL_58_16]OHC79723.1 MAG: hypothetical protein A3G18_08515 [Rhodospirillales bacterium RIFCSPLOWO2_12_FULL_58_28]